MDESNCYVENEPSLLDYLLILYKRRRMIAILTVGVTLIAVAVCFLIPKTYRAETRILTPTNRGVIGGQFLGQLGNVGGLDLSSYTGLKSTSELYIALTKSRPVLDAVIDRFNLMKLYRTSYRTDARNQLLTRLRTQDDKRSGIITIAFDDKEPRRAADIANAFVEELRTVNRGLAISEASQRRLFYEEQIRDVRESLIKAEESMKGFQEQTGAVKIDDQAKAVIQSIAQLRAQIAAKEVQLKVMRTYATRYNPDIQRAEEEVRGMREQLGRLEARGGSGRDSLAPTGRIPQMGTDYIRRMRELKFNETLYEILMKQLEVAKLDEARDATVIQVVEKAIAPEKKFGPRRMRITAVAGTIALVVSLLLAFAGEYIDRVRQNPSAAAKLSLLMKAFSPQKAK